MLRLQLCRDWPKGFERKVLLMQRKECFVGVEDQGLPQKLSFLVRILFVSDKYGESGQESF